MTFENCYHPTEFLGGRAWQLTGILVKTWLNGVSECPSYWSLVWWNHKWEEKQLFLENISHISSAVSTSWLFLTNEGAHGIHHSSGTTGETLTSPCSSHSPPLPCQCSSTVRQSSHRHVMPEQCQPKTQRVQPCRSPTMQERMREDLLQAPLQSESLRGWSRSRFRAENPTCFL